MSETRAVPTEFLARANMSGDTGQPLCPVCRDGRLQPYRVAINLTGLGPEGNVAGYGGWYCVDSLEGYVAVCVGNVQANQKTRETYARYGEDSPVGPDVPACGFSMPMTPKRAGYG